MTDDTVSGSQESVRTTFGKAVPSVLLGVFKASWTLPLFGLLSLMGSEQEFDGRPVLWAFRRFYGIFDPCCSRLRGAASSPDPRLAIATSMRLGPILSE